MKYLLIILMLSFAAIALSQDDQTLYDLNARKTNLEAQIGMLRDSLNSVTKEIESIERENFLASTEKSGLSAECRSSAAMRKSPNVYSEIVTEISKGQKVQVIDYTSGYFGVASEEHFGYLSDVRIIMTDSLKKFKSMKVAQANELKALAEENQRLKDTENRLQLEAEYKRRFGNKYTQRMLNNEYWIGMTKEMAGIALGTPKEVNRTLGSWGVHEQWVYGNDLYLYFENGILVSFQD